MPIFICVAKYKIEIKLQKNRNKLEKKRKHSVYINICIMYITIYEGTYLWRLNFIDNQSDIKYMNVYISLQC